MKNFKTYGEFIAEGKAVDKVKQQEEDMDAKELADILIITDVDEEKVNERKLPKRFTVKTKQTIDGTVYSPGDYALKKKRAGGGIYLNMDKGEMLGVDAANISKLEEGKLNERKFTEEERKELAKKGLALPNGSFPIVNVDDLKNAILSFGLAKNKDEAAKFIAKRAKALNADDLLPDTKDFNKALKEVATRVPAKTIAFNIGDEEDEAMEEADKNWSDKVKTDNELPEGTFTKSAKEIADTLKKYSDDLQQAMSRLNFYINRGGKGLDKKTIAELEKAKELLRKLY